MRLFFALFQYIYESQKYISEPKEKLTVPTDLIPELSARPEINESTSDGVNIEFTTDFSYHIWWL